MTTTTSDIRKAVQAQTDRFFATYPNPTMQKIATRALRFLANGDELMTGKPEGWAAGIIYYAMANSDHQACGVPGMLKAEFAQLCEVSMSTVREQAARVERAMEI